MTPHLQQATTQAFAILDHEHQMRSKIFQDRPRTLSQKLREIVDVQNTLLELYIAAGGKESELPAIVREARQVPQVFEQTTLF